MIPLRLTVNNFMCYRDNVPTLDLEPIHIACLCGENGHGKSALLDAITWALWGHARASTQDELIHQGQPDVSVELEFLARDQQYKVVRSHIRSGGSRQGKTDLNLFVASSGGFKAITGNTVRDTETRIRELLHMDYDTFINTAFLVQGRADLFTTANSSERKERLAEVLSLSYYERVEEQAKQQGREIQQNVQDAETKLAVKRQEAERRPEYEEALATINSEMDTLVSSLETLRKDTEARQRKYDELQTRGTQAKDIKRRLKEHREDIASLEKREAGHKTRVAEFEALVAQEVEVYARFAAYQKARTESERLTNALGRMTHLSSERSPLDQKIAAEEAILRAEIKKLSESIERDLEPKSARLPAIEQELESARQGLTRLEQEEQRLKSTVGKAEALTKDIAVLDQTIESLKTKMEETRKKFDLLDSKDATCPVCQQPLGPESQEHLRTEYESQGRRAKAEFKQSTQTKDTKERELQSLVVQRSQLEKNLAQQGVVLHRRIEGLERDAQQAREASEALKPARKNLAAVEQLLKTNDFAQNERQQLAALEAKVAELGYDADAHKATREQVHTLEQYVDLNRKVQEAKANLPAELETLLASTETLTRRRSDMAKLEQELAGFEQPAEDPTASQQAIDAVRQKLKESEAVYNEALRKQGAVQEQIARCEMAELEARGLEDQRTKLLDEKSVYDELQRAFGRNGIPALIIEAAIPQLESDANELLGRLTDGRMALKLELREGRKQKGVPTEALDIKIADEMGTRSYETFSGGEAFRINFALRIALSKLLARRSGAPLPILFIDEGFGSQDAAGQERLKESIQSIQNDFKKILVITHVEDIKEAFPVRIEVTKTPQGSTFVIA
ncbi:MAG: SMC family ATPase [Chloroflexi bacterium]|nr:SMC family ATPase [Chloroflexota bacterium]